jgi:flavin reductase (DIM6/NTAB) family NADH-FMN oxidoreductase RutF
VASGADLLAVMRRFPAGVAVVTVDAAGQRVGLTVASFVSLALEPPIVGVAIAKQAALHSLLREAGGFSVSLLAADQEALAQHFSRGVPPIAMWTGIELEPDDDGAPLVAGALGWLRCLLRGELDAGTHTFFTGEVTEARGGAAGPALVRLESGYRSS